MKDDIRNRVRQRFIDGAKLYALADKSDPFAFARAMAHINQGIVGRTVNGDPAEYGAEPYPETRYLPNGEAYEATVYRNVVRP